MNKVNKDKQLLLFGSKLREIREKQGYSQESFATQLGVHRTYMGGLERGERNPTLTVILRIAKNLKIPPSDLLHGI